MRYHFCLVNPPITMAERYGYLSSGGSHLPPLNIAQLASDCRKHGFQVSIIDAEVLHLGYEGTLSALKELEPDAVGFTSTTISIHNAARMAGMVKEALGIPTIIGGVHVSNAALDTMERFDAFDYGVCGEGDITTVELLYHLSDKSRPFDVPGVMYRQDGRIIKTAPRRRLNNLDDLPMPSWDLLPWLTRYYRPAANSFKRLPASSLITSRGCPGKCTFCSGGVFGNVMRAYSAEYLLEMIRILYYRYGIRDIIFHDDNFVTYKRRLREVCEVLIKEKLDLVWSATSRVDIVDAETLRLMKRAGCWQIAYGIESGDQRILDVIKKGITLEQVEQALRWTKEAGIFTRGYLMIGMPLETTETMRKSIDFIKRIDLDDFHISAFTPGPGTEALRDIDKYGDFNDDWRVMNYWNPLFIPHGLTRELILKYQSKAFREFYFRPRIIWNLLKTISTPAKLWILVKSAITLVLSLFTYRMKKWAKRIGKV